MSNGRVSNEQLRHLPVRCGVEREKEKKRERRLGVGCQFSHSQAVVVSSSIVLARTRSLSTFRIGVL